MKGRRSTSKPLGKQSQTDEVDAVSEPPFRASNQRIQAPRPKAGRLVGGPHIKVTGTPFTEDWIMKLKVTEEQIWKELKGEGIRIRSSADRIPRVQ